MELIEWTIGIRCMGRMAIAFISKTQQRGKMQQWFSKIIHLAVEQAHRSGLSIGGIPGNVLVFNLVVFLVHVV